MYVCMHVYVCVCMHVCMHVNMCLCGLHKMLRLSFDECNVTEFFLKIIDQNSYFENYAMFHPISNWHKL
jgi:hypothetical protein